MASISLCSNGNLVFLGADLFFYEKTGKTYYNVNLFDRISQSSVRVNCSQEIYNALLEIPELSNISCDFDFDLTYKNLRLKGFIPENLPFKEEGTKK